MAESSNADSSKGSAQGSEGTSPPSSAAPSQGSTEEADGPAEAPQATSTESGEAPAKSSGTSGWKTPSGKPAAKAAAKTTTAKSTAKAPAKAPAKSSSTRTSSTKTTEKPAKEKKPVDANQVRSWLATAIWALAVIAALIMAGGALAVSLDFNEKNAIVKFVTDTADNLKIFGDFKTFKGSNHEVKDVLVNNGIYAILYLVVGKILDRLIRP